MSTTNPSEIELNSVDQIDLDTHGIIEASAGTGKTYTIENLVIRLLRNGVSLEEILVVTFTDKAANELRERIRKQLESAQLRSNEMDNQDHDFQRQFSSSQICTIHSFCQSILREFAFENRMVFDFTLVDDQVLYKKVLHDLMRKDWPERYGAELKDHLIVSGFPGTIFYGQSEWEAKILEIAGKWKPEAGDLIEPKPQASGTSKQIRTQYCDVIEKLTSIVGPVMGKMRESSFLRRFERSQQSLRDLQDCISYVLIPVLSFIEKWSTQNEDQFSGIRAIEQDLSELHGHASQFSPYSKLGFCCLINKGMDDAEIEENCPGLLELVNGLQQLFTLKHQFSANAIADVRAAAKLVKQENGLISYDDMPEILANALHEDKNVFAKDLLGNLRRKYRVALVDEFQDTDVIQWKILYKLFVESSAKTKNRLFIIGDPKQAIYSFRGADLYAYQKAKTHLLNYTNAKCYRLAKNFRSVPELIDRLNLLFHTRSWFPEDSGIEYHPVSAPEIEARRSVTYEDTTGVAEFTLLDVGKAKKSREAQEMIANRIAEECQRLLSSRFVFAQNNRRVVLSAKDICILVRKLKEAEPIEEALRRQGIPFTYYKKPGLYQGTEALHLILLLKAVARPSDTRALRAAFLTCFFHVPPEQLEHLAEETIVRAKRMLISWRELALKRNWEQFFRMIFEDSSVFLRFIQQERLPAVSSFVQITRDLHRKALEKGLDLSGIIRQLECWQRFTDDIKDGSNIHQIETEESKIQIMTIHGSKGLEFPIVFLAGGLTGGRAYSRYSKIHLPGRQVTVYDLSGKYKGRLAEEELNENRRLYYVGLTRAQYKLFLPYYGASRGGSKGPIQKLIYPAVHEGICSHSTEFGPLSKQCEDPADVPMNTSDFSLHPDHFSLPEKMNFFHRVKTLDSFSGMLRKLSNPDAQIENQIAPFIPIGIRQNDEEHFHQTPLESNELPRGPHTGSMMHQILENLDFEKAFQCAHAEDLIASANANHDLIEYWMDYYQIASNSTPDQLRVYKREAAKILWHVLHVQLPHCHVCLGQIPKQDRIHELEFVFPGVQLKGKIPEIESSHYVTGIIDLVFRYQGKIYLVDWKMNYLMDSYSQSELDRSMAEHNYHLQYKLYTIALQRWLRIRKEKSTLAGIFYVFMRGIRKDSVEGIFSHFPTLDELHGYEHEVLETIRNVRQ